MPSTLKYVLQTIKIRFGKEKNNRGATLYYLSKHM